MPHLTADHSLLLIHLATRIGLDGKALEWVTSYLSNHTESVAMKYTQPLGDIVRKHGVKYHLYADDTQLNLTFDHVNLEAKQSSITTMEVCIEVIKAWMLSNKLKLSDGKTEFLHFCPHHKMALDTAATTIKFVMIPSIPYSVPKTPQCPA